MEAAFAIVVACLFAAAVYLLLSERLIRMLLGVALLGNAVILLLFATGRVMREAPPIIAAGMKTTSGATANPLPQALILTAIVISFSFFAFLLVLSYRTYEELETDDTARMKLAEPEAVVPPPAEY